MNKADRNYSIQPHGLHYDKRFQGSSYDDGKPSVAMISLNCQILGANLSHNKGRVFIEVDTMNE